MNILDIIITKKKIEVAERKREKDISDLEKTLFFKNKTRSFSDSLLRNDKTGIIAEFKRQSPSKGIINNTSTVTEVTGAYARYGASAISVLTDTEFFGGSLNDLQAAEVNEIPLLRKDFIVDEYQLVESKAFGADVILLIAACLTKAEVKTFAEIAKNLGLNVLLEVHNESELEHICDNVDVVGINNRDLKTFIVDINNSLVLGELIPAHIIKISESGIGNIASITLLKEHGFKGFLIGEKFMREKDPGLAFQNFAEGVKRQQ